MRRPLRVAPVVALALVRCLVGGAAEIESTAAVARITGPTQRWTVERGADGLGRLRSECRERGGRDWRPAFDAGLPLVTGDDFDLLPDTFAAERTGPGGAAILLEGRQPVHGFRWHARVDVDDRSPLSRLRVDCHLERPIVLRGLEPQFGLWIDSPDVAFAFGQGVASIDAGTAEARWGNCFPAALLWNDGVEAAMFVAAGSLDWMSPRNLFRFRDCRVSLLEDRERGASGLGLRVVTRNFHELAAGEVSWEAWIDARPAPRPSKREALAGLVRRFAPLHPATAPPLFDRLGGGPASWTEIAAGVDADLRLEGVVCGVVDLPEGRPWTDAPLFPEDRVTRLPVATDHALASACDRSRDRAAVVDGWDFSTCHNGLASRVVHDRLRPDAGRRAVLREKIRGLRLFLDADAGLIRHGTRHPPHVGDKEMAWQSLMFAIETARLWRSLDPADADPAIGGTVLLGTDGLTELARENGHLLPQWFDPVTKRPLPQADQPDLGIVHEPWQAGSYAWLLTEAATIDGDDSRLAEARLALDRLFEPLRFRVTNARYDVAYDDPTDYPVTEIFGTAWGIAACTRLETGDGRWTARGDEFLDSLLRLTPWYESALRDDARDRAVRGAGLFVNHAGAYTGSPWENSEAALALSVRIRDDLLRGRIPREPLLAVMNLQRRNAPTFFPRCCAEEASACPRLVDHPARSLPIEDAYTVEHGGLHGGTGRAAYMAGAAFAYELLFEALGTAEEPDVMLLNLDAVEGTEASLRGVVRRFVAFNPLAAPVRTRLAFRALPPARYRMSAGDPLGEHDADALAAGVEVEIPAGGHQLVVLERIGGDAESARLAAERRALDRLAAEWAALHRAARRSGMTPELERRRDAWRADRDRLRAGRPDAAE